MNKRIFIGLDLSSEARQKLKKYCDTSFPVRWTVPENFHVTLNFLGDTDEDELERVLNTVQQVSASFTPMQLRVKEIKAVKYMIWAVVQPTKELELLHRKLSDELSAAGLGRRQHQSFRPHISLARTGKENTFSHLDFRPTQVNNVAFEVTHAVVFESILKPGGPQYISIDAFEFLNEK